MVFNDRTVLSEPQNYRIVFIKIWTDGSFINGIQLIYRNRKNKNILIHGNPYVINKEKF